MGTRDGNIPDVARHLIRLEIMVAQGATGHHFICAPLDDALWERSYADEVAQRARPTDAYTLRWGGGIHLYTRGQAGGIYRPYLRLKSTIDPLGPAKMADQLRMFEAAIGGIQLGDDDDMLRVWVGGDPPRELRFAFFAVERVWAWDVFMGDMGLDRSWGSYVTSASNGTVVYAEHDIERAQRERKARAASALAALLDDVVRVGDGDGGVTLTVEQIERLLALLRPAPLAATDGADLRAARGGW